MPVASNKSKITNRKSKISLGFSPCPNDTFIFDAMVHGKVDTEGLDFDFILDDVDYLNKKALNSELDITKISFFAYASIFKKYQLLDSGSALGSGCGPLLVGKKIFSSEELKSKKIAIPGFHTTANFLMSFAFPEIKNKTFLLFSDIENSVLSGTYDAGVIIHESRFTYEQKGLFKIVDLGEIWEQKTNMPIPLGGIAIKRSLDKEMKEKVQRIMRKSVELALQNPDTSKNFVKCHAQAMDPVVIQKHIDLYVNEYSVSLGNKGKDAIHFLHQKAFDLKLIKKIPEDIFV